MYKNKTSKDGSTKHLRKITNKTIWLDLIFCNFWTWIAQAVEHSSFELRILLKRKKYRAFQDSAIESNWNQNERNISQKWIMINNN